MKKLLLLLLCVPFLFSCGEKEQSNAEIEHKKSSNNNSHIDTERCTSFFLKQEESKTPEEIKRLQEKADRNEWYSCLCEKLLVKYESFDNIIESANANQNTSILLECMEQFGMSIDQK
jgi:hypothetical protein